VTIEKLSKEEWFPLSANAQIICFGAKHDPSIDRIDYALVAMEGRIPRGFITVREVNRDHAYWQFGGALPGTKGTLFSFRAFELAKEWSTEFYDSVSAYIENTNIVMLKLAMKIGFRIVGIKHTFGTTLVELFLNLREEVI
jgi:hypothetical protein